MTSFGTGIVFDYDADLKVYRVNLDGHGDITARRILTGIDKPYPARSRVILMRLSGVEWAIIGELDMSPVPPEESAEKTVDEAAAELINLAKRSREDAALGELPPFRPEGEEIQFVGDASLENRTDNQESRSRVKVYSFGAVLAKASNFCHTLWDRKTSQIIQQSRNLIQRCIGQLITMTTPSDTGLSTYREVTQGDAVSRKEGDEAMENLTDKEVTRGHIPAPAGRGADLINQPTAKFGERTKYREHRVEEVDNEAQVIRTRQDQVDDDDNHTIETQSWEGNLDEVSGSFGTVKKYREWLEVRIDNETEEATFLDLKNDQKILIHPDGITISRAGSVVEISDDSIALTGKAINIEASDEIVLKSPNIRGLTSG